MILGPATGHPAQVQHGRMAGGCAVGVAVDHEVLIKSEQRVVERRSVRAHLDAGQPDDVTQVSPVQLDASFEPAGRALLLGPSAHRLRVLVADQEPAAHTGGRLLLQHVDDVELLEEEGPRVGQQVERPVHLRRLSARGRVIPCRCGQHHREHDPAIGTPLAPDSYDYDAAVLWQAHAGQLWHRFTVALRRGLAARLGVPGWRFREYARLSYAKVAEYQRRGLVHFHAAIRLDGPDGPADPAPPGLVVHALHDAILEAARSVTLEVTRPDGTALVLGWGVQVDVRRITPTRAQAVEDEHGEITDAALAGYIAEYATKGTGKTDGHPDRPIRSGHYIAHLAVSDHHRRIIQTCWRLGGLDRYEELNLRKWAHMLGFRGHFLTKSQRYSTTFRAIRRERRVWRLAATLDQLDGPPELKTITVVNDWRLVGIGHHTNADRELALAIAERRLQHRSTRRAGKETRP